ncbi:multidrug resistance-associated ABC transporter [Ephemerocybe angulata]|uniref:Multidrug resistance-associated ABC transporter n=1 Tax=Ephemerocybe angulata TaxID=980116 RepID=A0A8H6HLA1_9AGAR|nr:multidrug resistance-associated ABC transporter [Tulosesus angulatus]
MSLTFLAQVWAYGLERMPTQILAEAMKSDAHGFAIPLVAAFISILTLTIQRVMDHKEPVLRVEGRTGTLSRLVGQNGGIVIFSFMIARILGCAIVVGLSATTMVFAHLESPRWDVSLFADFLGNTFLFLANLYALSLACLAVVTRRWSGTLVRHNIAIMLSELAVYVYRDLWPLATYNKDPMDLDEGWLLWVKVTALFLVAVVIPVCIPNIYVPADPKHPAAEPHPEQTASWLSYQTYSYLSPVVKAAGKTAHLPASELPPLADYDGAKRLSEQAAPHLNPAKVRKGRHIFFGLIQVFAPALLKSVVAVTIFPLAMFVPPLAVNRLLTDLETGGQKPTVRPWFWIASMFVAPIVGSMAYQIYIIVMTRALANAEAILTQIIFDYSLKIRIKAEPSEDPAEGTPVADADASVSNSDGRPKEPVPKTKTVASFIGRLNNLVTIDMNNITGARNLALLFWLTPFQIVGCSLFLYILLGWSAFVGLGLMVILLPVPGYLSSVLQGVQEEKMKKTDNRTQTVTESMSVLRMVKMFGWERKIQEKIDQRREEELTWVWKSRILKLIVAVLTYCIPTVTMLATYGTATLLDKIELTPATVFSSMILFETIRDELHKVAGWMLSEFIAGKVSIDRLNRFFRETELLDAFEDETPSDPVPASRRMEDGAVGFRNTTFTWSPSSSTTGVSTPHSQFKLTVPGELLFKKGKINLIIGPTGSGKTSLLMALLGEMHFSPTPPDSAFSLPRAGGVSFAVQESWVQNETVRDNILFHSPYDEQRYKKVIHQCALEQDLALFEAGDLTEVGERGLTLSGGQKARLTLARAIYSKAEIVLLDDVLAALDVHTAVWIVNKCFKGDLVQGRTVLLVTHNIALASPIADFIVTITPDGVATSRGEDIKAVLASDPALKVEFEHDEQTVKEDGKVVDAPEEETVEADGKLVVAEEIQQGLVSSKAIKLFFKALGGDHAILFFSLWFLGYVFENVMHSVNLWFLGYWSSQYESHPPEEVPVVRYLWTYVGLSLFMLAGAMSREVWFITGVLRASRIIHKLLVESVLGTTLRWLDETPVSRILTRMTLDISSVDGQLMSRADSVHGVTLEAIVALISAVFFVPLFTLPGLFIAGYGMWLGSQYVKAQLSVKREKSNAKAPMLAHFEAAISGLVSLRAYGVEAAYREELQKRIDHYVRISRMNYDLNRWINFRIDVLGAMFTASLAAYLTYASTISAANVGFSLNRSVKFATGILWVVRLFNMFQVEANSLERISAYIDIEQEPKPTEKGKPPAAWPTSGEIRAEHLTSRYSKTGPAVLHDLSFTIRAGERVGVVGRTGSGKSSLTLSLLRCILTEGKIYFDGVLTSEVNLDALRSNITIIPQMPELLSGTLRYNLDPFDEYDDATLNGALRSSGLYGANTDGGEGRLKLDSNIASGGSNVSVGQRQLIALARAVVRSSKLLILDEATSAIDHDTDSIIQHTLRKELGSDVTVVTIAHRLQTIIDADRIMVLDAGRIAEFASPAELLAKPKSLFKALVDESGDRADLYEAAARKAKLV